MSRAPKHNAVAVTSTRRASQRLDGLPRTILTQVLSFLGPHTLQTLLSCSPAWRRCDALKQRCSRFVWVACKVVCAASYDSHMGDPIDFDIDNKLLGVFPLSQFRPAAACARLAFEASRASGCWDDNPLQWRRVPSRYKLYKAELTREEWEGDINQGYTGFGMQGHLRLFCAEVGQAFGNPSAPTCTERVMAERRAEYEDEYAE